MILKRKTQNAKRKSLKLKLAFNINSSSLN